VTEFSIVGIPKLVGITGRAQHGKDTVAAILGGVGYKRAAFADQLKEMALVLNPIVFEGMDKDPHRITEAVRLYGWEGAKQEPEVRRFLQVLGTEAARGFFGDDVWVDALHRKLGATVGREPIVVSDVRFPNEAAWVIRMGGEVWRVVRAHAVPTDSPDLYENDADVPYELVPFDNGLGTDHPSEAYVDSLPVALTISNEGTLDQLEAKVKSYIGARGLAA